MSNVLSDRVHGEEETRITIVEGGIGGLSTALFLSRAGLNNMTVYEQAPELRKKRASRIQKVSRGRREHPHMPDGEEQRKRDAEFAKEDPLGHND